MTCSSPTPLETPLELKENDLVLTNILMLVPACIAGIGGTLLGDKIGLWIKENRGSR